mmetsp:Transcript_113571/g.294177  ORF Transcript_113571/g.294177 Transcript_113571/m.294177 type:complete len:206 (-) Transcript_113571:1231-1848(-)
MEDPRGASREGGGVLLLRLAIRLGRHHMAPSLDADDFHGLVLQESREHPNGVRATADASNNRVGQPAGAVGESGVFVRLVEHLGAGLVADDRLELADDIREGMRPNSRADDVVGGADVCHPIPHGLIDGILQRLRPALGRHDLRTQHLHAEHVERLPLHVDCPHVDDALEAHQRASRRSRNAMLSSARLGDDPLLAQLLGEQGLA